MATGSPSERSSPSPGRKSGEREIQVGRLVGEASRVVIPRPGERCSDAHADEDPARVRNRHAPGGIVRSSRGGEHEREQQHPAIAARREARAQASTRGGWGPKRPLGRYRLVVARDRYFGIPIVMVVRHESASPNPDRGVRERAQSSTVGNDLVVQRNGLRRVGCDSADAARRRPRAGARTIQVGAWP